MPNFTHDPKPAAAEFEREVLKANTAGNPVTPPAVPVIPAPMVSAVVAVLETQKGEAGGLATLDNNKKIPLSQMQMAEETAEKFAEIEEALTAVVGTPGPAGPRGTPGPRGPVGLDGAKGDTGSAGPKGDDGASGPAGPKGDRGDDGPQGPPGDAGPDGSPGSAGLQGEVGPQGPKGDAGPQGLKGDTGSQGLKGDTGSQGLKGDTGLQGPKGDTGSQGSAGAPLSSSAAIGYAAGAGGAVTQLTNRTTGVTINKAAGAITLFSKTTTANLVESFTVTNSMVAATDVVVLSVRGTAIFKAFVTQVAAGSFRISVQTPAATTAEAPIINYAVFKGVIA